MKRKLIANALLIIMIFAVLTGCSSSNENAASSSGNAEKSELSETETAELIDEYKESADMRLNKYSFSDDGGPVMNIYIDEESYDKAEFEGSFLVIPAGSGESGTYMETSFRMCKSVKSLSKTILSEYGEITESTDEGMLFFDGFEPTKLVGHTENGLVVIAYLTDVVAGVLATVIVVPENELKTHGVQMQAMAQTTIIL